MKHSFDLQKFVAKIIRKAPAVLILTIIGGLLAVPIFGTRTFNVQGVANDGSQNIVTSLTTFKAVTNEYDKQDRFIGDVKARMSVNYLKKLSFLEDVKADIFANNDAETLSRFNLDKDKLRAGDLSKLVDIMAIELVPYFEVQIQEKQKGLADILMASYTRCITQSLPKFISQTTFEIVESSQIEVINMTGIESIRANSTLLVILGGLVGFILGILAVLVFDVFDPKIRDDDDVDELGLPVLGRLKKIKA